MIATILFLSAAQGLATVAAELKPATLEAFEKYIHEAEKRLESDTGGFLWADQAPNRKEQVLGGEVLAQPWSGRAAMNVPNGLIHDWVGSVFIPGTTLAKTLALVQNYDQHKQYYQPEVIDSKLLSHNANDYKIHLRLLKKKVLTVVLSSEHDVRYFPIDKTRWRSRSYSTKIAELENPGKPGERELPAGTGHGFLWRLNSYWRFQERDGGVWVECEAISLTRNVPTGLGWMIEPIIRNLPKESLANTLRATRTALQK